MPDNQFFLIECQFIFCNVAQSSCMIPSCLFFFHSIIVLHLHLSGSPDSLRSFVNEAVDGVPKLPLPVGGEEAKERKGEAARLVELLVLWLHAAADPHCLLELTMATEYHTTYKHLQSRHIYISEEEPQQ